MLDYSKIKKVATDLHPGTGEEWFKKDSFITRYHLGTYDLDNELRVLNRAVMTYMTYSDFTEEEAKEAKNLLFFINDLTEVVNYIRRTQEAYEKAIEESQVKQCSICGSRESFGMIKVDGEEEYHCWPDCKETVVV
jgi:hypothetical protein